MNDLSDIKLVLQLASPVLQQIRLGSGLTQCTVDVLRTDLLHPVISGNKFYKLCYYLLDFKKQAYNGIVSFGGAFSNHLIATAAVCQALKIPFTAVIRGEAPLRPGHTLIQLEQLGADLHYVKRSLFPSEHFDNGYWHNIFPGHYIIQAGGEGEAGVKGAALIAEEIPFNAYDEIFLAVGTGTTMAGILQKMQPHQQVNGILALKLPDIKSNSITKLLQNNNPRNQQFKLFGDYHLGGFGKSNEVLWTYMNDLYERTKVPTDHVYTAKLFYGVEQLLNQSILDTSKKILIIHTGGLQGNLSLKKNVLIF
ncbi:1-aminocyclopropane-1-carboxylate deaminase/D-cysteine desulfhydrase [Gynurincola endophyticus]|uniref:1-aminocyclopropane-1-carboxylate deaminase/D-cysteine desulfhydrase n=1 Tax=Gynurincola endophyticus TaxID=2479004 RepID=UPI00131511B1|nr:pyridoxal-phosphate dependent enzyme [Gynurincola endophyticus]